jgi:hypothetical protein
MERETMFAQEDTWRQERLGRFTASSFHKLMTGGKRPMTPVELEARPKTEKRVTVDTLFGDGAMTYINEIIAEYITGEAAEQRDFKQTEWGQANELDAILSFQEATGFEVDYYGISNPKFFPYGKMGGGSPDGLAPKQDAIIEVKCPYCSSNHVAYLKAAMMPENEHGADGWFAKERYDYYIQMQKNMLVTQTNNAYFVSYDPRVVNTKKRLVIFRISRNDEIIQEMISRLNAAEALVAHTLDLLTL